VNQYDKVQELQITYFCGTEWECGDGQSWKALQKAKVQRLRFKGLKVHRIRFKGLKV